MSSIGVRRWMRSSAASVSPSSSGSDLVGGDAEVAGQRVGDGLEQVGAGVVGAGVADGGDGPLDRRRAGRTPRPGPASWARARSLLGDLRPARPRRGCGPSPPSGRTAPPASRPSWDLALRVTSVACSWITTRSYGRGLAPGAGLELAGSAAAAFGRDLRAAGGEQVHQLLRRRRAPRGPCRPGGSRTRSPTERARWASVTRSAIAPAAALVLVDRLAVQRRATPRPRTGRG